MKLEGWWFTIGPSFTLGVAAETPELPGEAHQAALVGHTQVAKHAAIHPEGSPGIKEENQWSSFQKLDLQIPVIYSLWIS